MNKVKIHYTSESYVVILKGARGQDGEIGYGDNLTSIEEHAANLYELCVCLGIDAELVKE